MLVAHPQIYQQPILGTLGMLLRYELELDGHDVTLMSSRISRKGTRLQVSRIYECRLRPRQDKLKKTG